MANSFRLLLCGLAFLCAASGAENLGVLSGRVVDPADGAIASARVEIYEHHLGRRREAITEPDGRFRFENLPTGPYAVVLSAPGFRQRLIATVDVQPGQETDAGSLRLELGRCNTPGGSICDSFGIDEPLNPNPAQAPPVRRLIGPSVIRVFTVCELLNELPDYDGQTVVVVGRVRGTGEGVWLSEDCGSKLSFGGAAWPTEISLSYSADRFATPPHLPEGFGWTRDLLYDALAQVKKTTRLSEKHDEWAAVFGRVEAMHQIPIKWTEGDRTATIKEGFGHLAESPAQLISPSNGYLSLR